MDDLRVALISTCCSVIGTLAANLIVSKKEHQYGEIRANREQQKNLYNKVYHEAKKLRFSRDIVFDERYEKTLVSYLAEVELLSSAKTRKAFKELGSFVHEIRSSYKAFHSEHNPYLDPDFFDDNGVPIHIPSELEDAFNNQMRQYRREHIPSISTVDKYIDALCNAMREDLGMKENEEI